MPTQRKQTIEPTKHATVISSPSSSFTGALVFLFALTALLTGLKTAFFHGWTWFGVLSPLWLTLGVFIFVALIAALEVAIVSALAAVRKRKADA